MDFENFFLAPVSRWNPDWHWFTGKIWY